MVSTCGKVSSSYVMSACKFALFVGWTYGWWALKNSCECLECVCIRPGDGDVQQNTVVPNKSARSTWYKGRTRHRCYNVEIMRFTFANILVHIASDTLHLRAVLEISWICAGIGTDVLCGSGT
jgi:hypothetical protein